MQTKQPPSQTPIPRKKYEVAVIGGGITGLSTAYHLMQLGIKELAVISAPQLPAHSWQIPGFISGGQADNFTRLSHAYGQDLAAELWQWGDDAFDMLLAFAKTHGLPHATAGRIRLLTSTAELHEGQQAVEQLQAAGFTSRLVPKHAARATWPAFGPRVLAVQDDGPRGGSLTPLALQQQLLTATRDLDHYTIAARTLKSAASAIHIGWDDRATAPLTAEAVVLACDLGIGQLLPELAAAFVPIADQWLTVSWPASGQRPVFPGLAFSANHAYEWGLGAADHAILGGARYLRPRAGVDQHDPQPEARISAHLLRLLADTIPSWASAAHVGHSAASTDIRPCDELPVVGPMFGEARILLATGYMGQGLTLGFAAGKHLAELLAHGQSPGLPRRLWPERLRSLTTTSS